MSDPHSGPLGPAAALAMAGDVGPLGPERQPPRLSGRNSYSLFVGFMKVLLPALAAALVLLVIVWPQLRPDDDRFRIGVSELSLEQGSSLSMLNARFDGFDDKNRPFSLTADMATQATGEDDIVELELPKADITLADGTWLAIAAKSGRYSREAKRLGLSGDVVVFHDRGFEIRTEAADIDLEAGTAEGTQPVEGQGPSGFLAGEGFRVLDRGQRLLLIGKSSMVLYPEAGEEFR